MKCSKFQRLSSQTRTVCQKEKKKRRGVAKLELLMLEFYKTHPLKSKRAPYWSSSLVFHFYTCLWTDECLENFMSKEEWFSNFGNLLCFSGRISLLPFMQFLSIAKAPLF